MAPKDLIYDKICVNLCFNLQNKRMRLSVSSTCCTEILILSLFTVATAENGEQKIINGICGRKDKKKTNKISDKIYFLL